jgi:hypothetical protein
MFPSTNTSACSPRPSSGFRGRPLTGSPAVLHLHRYHGFIRLLHTLPTRLRSPLTCGTSSVGCLVSLPRRCIRTALGLARLPRVSRPRIFGRRCGALLGSWGALVETCPGLGTPAALGALALTVIEILPSTRTTVSASAMTDDFGADSSRPASSLCTLRTHWSPNEWQHSLPACPLRL